MKNSILLVLGLICIFFVSCTRQENELIILTEHYPPLSFVENGVTSGYGADVVAAIQNELNTNIEPELMEWDKAYQRALVEKNIVLFTMEKTPEREAHFYFIGPLGENTTFFYALAENPIQLKDLEAAKAVSAIATTKDWFTEQHLIDQGFTNLKSHSDPIQNIRMLINKETELGVFTDVTFPQLAKSAGIDPNTLRPVLDLMSSEYYIAISKKTDLSVIKKWENAFNTLVANGELESIRGKWFPQGD